MSREVPDVRRLVVKVGSSAIVGADGHASTRRMGKVAGDLAGVALGRECVLVSSGAIAAGLGPMGLEKRPRDMATLQAAAAVGQGHLVEAYARLFGRRGLLGAQVLLTQDDFVRRRHFVNARQTLERLLRAGIVPIVNENDTVATEEIRYGDNDLLAAMVAVMIDADLLVLLSDVEGIYDRDPRRGGAALLEEVRDPLGIEAAGPSGHGSGGMASKLEAAGVAAAAGIGSVVTKAATRDVLLRIVAGEPLGTWVPPNAARRRGRKAWIGSVLRPRGRVLVDAGAARAVRDQGRSLLAAGVTGVEGEFDAGDPVEIAGPEGPFARGIANYSSRELPGLAGKTSGELTSHPGGPYDREVIHRDELAVIDGKSDRPR